MMRFDIVTLFPEMPLLIEKFGITARASKLGLWQLKCWNPRDFVFDAHKTVDDRPFGGGPGMVLLAEPLADAVDAIRRDGNHGKVIAFAPSGTTLNDEKVRSLAEDSQDLILICGRYEGIDQRFLDTYVDETLSIGDYVLSGGELPAWCSWTRSFVSFPVRLRICQRLTSLFLQVFWMLRITHGRRFGVICRFRMCS